MAISLTTPDYPKVSFKVSPLCYVCKTYPQYQVAVKLLGSFRLTAGNRHLHRYCIFTEQIPETVLQSLYHSCTSELTRQGISLFVPFVRRTISSTFFRKCHGVWSLRGLMYWIVSGVCAHTLPNENEFDRSQLRLNSFEYIGFALAFALTPTIQYTRLPCWSSVNCRYSQHIAMSWTCSTSL